MNQDLKKVKTQAARMAYLNIFKPKSVNGGDPRYSIQLIFDKVKHQETIAHIKAAMEQAWKAGAQKLRRPDGTIPALEEMTNPLKDGDVDHPGSPVYSNCMYMTVSSKDRPGIVDINRVPITDPSEVYSGMIGRATFTCVAYNYQGTCGIACYLGNIQKLADGERITNKVSAQDDFDDEADDYMK